MRLTPFAKLFIALVILGVVGYVVHSHFDELHRRPLPPRPDYVPPGGPEAPGPGNPGKPGPAGTAKTPDGRIVIGVNDFGGGYPLLLANDGALPGPGSLFKKAGLDVEIRLIRGSKERLRAFEDGDVHVMLLTLDYLANLVPVFKDKGIDLRSFLLVDWSRGNIGIAAKPDFTSIESLKKARIATTRNTPTHYFLLSLLAKSNLTPAEIDTVKGNLVFATKTPQAGELFQRGEVDAVSIWEPHLSEAIEGEKGVTLVTTETATNLIADVLFSRKDWLDAHRDKLAPLAQAYFSAVEQLDKDPARAIELSAAAFQQKPAQIEATLKKTKPATFADNRAFFGMETESCAYDALFLEASRFWQREGLIKEPADPQRTKFLAALETLLPQYKDQKVVEKFAFNSAPEQQSPSLLTKSVSIYFASGQSSVDPNARRVLDGFAETLSVFQNAYVQVEGNTDNVGGRTQNVALSRARAEAVIAYLVERHRLDRARFIALGNGPDRPLADNATAEGREINRRTDFKIIKNSGPSDAAAAPAENKLAIEPAAAPAAPAAPARATDPPAPAGARPPPDPPPAPTAVDRRTILRAILPHLQAFYACYRRLPAHEPGFQGRAVLAFTIDDKGGVSESVVRSSNLDSREADDCIARTAQRMKFPKLPGTPLHVSYPLVFQSSPPPVTN